MGAVGRVGWKGRTGRVDSKMGEVKEHVGEDKPGENGKCREESQ